MPFCHILTVFAISYKNPERNYVMLAYQKMALENVRAQAKADHMGLYEYLDRLCRQFDVDEGALIKNVLQSPITINFHPDRLVQGGITILESLIRHGRYHGQFRTGTTNGGKTAYIGGDRFLWEQALFQGAYPADAIDRPKYGALNIFRYLDGGSVRFGSCFFIMKQDILHRCTFSYGDSSSHPAVVCTSDTFACVLAALLKDVEIHQRMLNQVVSSLQEAFAILLSPSRTLRHLGRNLDNCIETHIHGDIALLSDVACFYLDSSYRDTLIEQQAAALCQMYEIELHWLPERHVYTEEIGKYFRGPAIPIVAKKIDDVLGNHQGVIHAELIGRASRDSEINPENWSDIGTKEDMFQYLKQLWHTVGYFG